MSKIKLWLKALRAPFFTATVMSGVLGSVCAWHDVEKFNWIYFLLTITGILALNSGTNLINDYFDHRSGADKMNKNYNRFSGGSRVIQDGLISPRTIFRAGIFSFCLAAMIGLYLNYVSEGNILLWVGIAGIFLGYFYTAEPLRLGYTPFGELITGICCGPLIVGGAYFVQTGTLNSWAVLISVPIGILVAMILCINGFPDRISDRAAGKKTLAVVLGREKAFTVYRFFIILSYISVLAGAIAGIFPYYTLAVILTVPIAVTALKTGGLHYNKFQELLPANEATIKLHLAFCFILTGAYLADNIFRL